MPIPILLKVCGEAQNAVNRQAEAAEGKRSLRPGPKIAVVKAECTLELFHLGKGSTTLDFASMAGEPSAQIPLGFPLPIRSEEAVSGVVSAIKELSKKRGQVAPQDLGVLDTLNKLGEVFDRGVTRVDLTIPRHNGSKRVSVKYTPEVYKRVSQSIAQQPRNVSLQDEITVEGLLELAEGKCSISPTLGDKVVYAFNPEKADEVIGAMGKPVKAKINTRSKRIEGIEIQPPPFGTDFFAHKSIHQLIAEQGIKPIGDTSVFDGDLSDDDVDSLIAEIHQGRGA